MERFYSSPHHRRRWKHLVAVAPGIVAPLPSPREESSSSHPGPPGGGLSRVNGFIDVASAMKVPPSLEDDKKITPSSHVRVSQPPPLAPLQPADFHAIARLGKVFPLNLTKLITSLNALHTLLLPYRVVSEMYGFVGIFHMCRPFWRRRLTNHGKGAVCFAVSRYSITWCMRRVLETKN